MDKELQEQLERLEREIWGEDKDLSDILADDVLSDVDALLAQDAAERAAREPEVPQPAPEPAPQEPEEEEDEDEEDDDPDVDPAKENLTLALLIIASVLCMGVMGVMIYWLETFL